MNTIHINIVGIIAGICTTVSFVPQIIKIMKTKHTRDISLYMYVILTSGIFMWLIYGILEEKLPIILANSVGFLLCSYIITAKLKYK